MVHFSTCSDCLELQPSRYYDLMENPKTIASCAELFQVLIEKGLWFAAVLQDTHSHLDVPALTCRWIIACESVQVCLDFPLRSVYFLLFSLSNHSCTSRHCSIKSLRLADHTTLIGLISGGNELAYRSKTDSLVIGCSDSNLELNAVRTVEIIVNFRLKPVTLDPNTVEFFHFLGTFINASSP